MLRYLRIRALLMVSALICLGLGWYVASVVGFPVYRGFNAALLTQPSIPVVIAGLFGSAGAFFLGVLVSTLLCRRIRYDAGLACAGFVWLAFSVQGGSAFYTLAGASRGVYLLLGLELLLLAGFVTLAWAGLWWAVKKGLLPDHHPLPKPESDEPLDQKLLATASMAATMIVAMTLFCQTDDKKQVLAAVGISSFLGTLAAYAFIPTKPVGWYMAGALVVGLLGYITGFFSPTGLEIGQPTHFFRALARPLPLDYAAAAPLGTIWAFWVSRNWHARRVEGEDEDEAQAPQPLTS